LSTADILQLLSLVLLTFSVVLAAVSIRKYRNSRGIDFILQAESAIDPLYQRLVGAEPDLIRNAYRGFGVDDLSDEDCRIFPFMHGVYSQVSRMYFILSAKRLDYGLDGQLRKEMIQAWVRELEQYRGHSAMRVMHRHAIQVRNFNTAFLQLAEEVLGDGNKDIVQGEGHLPTTTGDPSSRPGTSGSRQAGLNGWRYRCARAVSHLTKLRRIVSSGAVAVKTRLCSVADATPCQRETTAVLDGDSIHGPDHPGHARTVVLDLLNQAVAQRRIQTSAQTRDDLMTLLVGALVGLMGEAAIGLFQEFWNARAKELVAKDKPSAMPGD
jgi:hypothetical protein